MLYRFPDTVSAARGSTGGNLVAAPQEINGVAS